MVQTKNTCLKIPKLQNFVKCLVKDVKQGPLYGVIFEVLQNSFKVIYYDQATIETSTLPAICIFKRSNPIVELIFQNSGIFISFVTSVSLNWTKRAQNCMSCIEDDRKIKINVWWNFKVKSLFLRSISQIIAILFPMMTSSTQNWLNKGPKLVSLRGGICLWNYFLKIQKF